MDCFFLLISTSHDILLVSFVSQSEYNDTKCKMKLLCDQNKKKKIQIPASYFPLAQRNGFDMPSVKLACYYYLSLKHDFLCARDNLILI